MSAPQTRLFVTFLLCVLVLLPAPHWVYDGCRVRYRLRNRVLSKDVEDEQDESNGKEHAEDHDEINGDLKL